jgi:hypothetical protein
VLGRHDQVICNPTGVETGFLGSCRGRREALGAERLAVVRQDQPEVEVRHRRVIRRPLSATLLLAP